MPHAPVCPSINPSISCSPSTSSSACLSVRSSLGPLVCPYVCLSAYLPVRPSIYLSVCSCICLSVCPSVCVSASVCLSLYFTLFVCFDHQSIRLTIHHFVNVSFHPSVLSFGLFICSSILSVSLFDRVPPSLHLCSSFYSYVHQSSHHPVRTTFVS